MPKTVVAAMSGGVDSSAAAALLKEQGYNVIGITLNVWPREETACARTCCSITDVDDARMVCSKLGIPHYVLNMRDTFKKSVIDYFVDEYMLGRTPNPCIACNEHVKFKAMMKKAEALGADYIATGHYATIEHNNITNEYLLHRSFDIHKDQTYVLYMLTQNQLSKILLPCGGYDKKQVRAIAEKYELPTFKKPDSQDLCFIGAGGYAGFIRKNCSALARPGDLIDSTGHVIGRHDGIYNFTIGQHKGLGKFSNEKLYVTEINAQSAQVFVGKNEELFASEMLVEDMKYMLSGHIIDGQATKVKIRYNSPEADAVTHFLPDGRLKVIFAKPQRAITPGQAAVFYKHDVVLGGGVIAQSFKNSEWGLKQ